MIKIKNQESNLVLLTSLIREVRGLTAKSGINREQIEYFRKRYGIKEVHALPYGRTALLFISPAEAERVRKEAAEERARDAASTPPPAAPAALDERFDRLLNEVRANSAAINCLIQSHNRQIDLLQRVQKELGAHATAEGVTQ